jgi:hypothetical protein
MAQAPHRGHFLSLRGQTRPATVLGVSGQSSHLVRIISELVVVLASCGGWGISGLPFYARDRWENLRLFLTDKLRRIFARFYFSRAPAHFT